MCENMNYQNRCSQAFGKRFHVSEAEPALIGHIIQKCLPDKTSCDTSSNITLGESTFSEMHLKYKK